MSETDVAARIGGRTRGRGDFASAVNVGDTERIACAVAGGMMTMYGLTRRFPLGWMLALAGGFLAYRGLTGHCAGYASLGIDTSARDFGPIEGNLGLKLETSITVDAPRDRLYRIWRNFENLPRFMSHIERVTVVDPTHSHWRVNAAAMPVEWDATIINDKPNELIAWRTLDNRLVEHAGSVRFEPAADGTTSVRVSLQYDPPGGKVGHALASLLGQNPQQQIDDDLRAFKRAVESGQLAA